MSIANAKLRAIELITEGESFKSWMYLDSVSQVTIGYGTMMPDAASAAAIELRHPDRKLATPDEKRKEWRRLRAISPAGTDINYTAEHYRKDATLFITETEGSRLRLLKLDAFIEDLRVIYPRFSSFPEDAQVALMDMIYNLGWKIRSVFKKFTEAINDPKGPDWKAAAAQSRRPQLSKERNKAVEDLFLAAARTAAIEARNRAGKPAVRTPN